MQSISGRLCRAFPASELLLTPESLLLKDNKKSLLFAISRSGTTTETLNAVKRFKDYNSGEIIALTNYGDSSLASLGDFSIFIPAGQEQSVAQTRSFASLYVCICALASLTNDRKFDFYTMHSLPSTGERLITNYENLADKFGNDRNFEKYYVLGSGYRYGLASEVSLKLKEMSLAHSQPFYFLEFRHGPISMVDTNTLVIGLLAENSRNIEYSMIEDIREIGGKTMLLAEKDADINFESGVSELLRGVLYLPVLQLLAYYRAVSQGLNPDKPRNLTSVVTLDL
jgi:glucosamine--fructose-6-phosphate aminotransferase (isomerizing)